MFSTISCEAVWSWAFVCWEFLITDPISLLVIGLFTIFISSRFILGRLYICKILSISSSLSILLVYKLFIIISYNPLYFCSVGCNFISFLFLILLTWYLNFSWWVCLKVNQCCLSFQNQLLDLLILISILFISVLICISSFLLLILCFVCSSFSSLHRCNVRWLILQFFLFPEVGLYHYQLSS